MSTFVRHLLAFRFLSIEPLIGPVGKLDLACRIRDNFVPSYTKPNVTRPSPRAVALAHEVSHAEVWTTRLSAFRFSFFFVIANEAK
jgi:protein gp37